MLKIYTLIYDFSLSTPIETEGKTVSVVFGGGCKALRQNGEFSTTDRKLQEAIEGSSGYGKVYKLHRTFRTADDDAVKPAETPAVAVVPEGEALTEKVCATVNEAAEWLTGQGYRKIEVNTSAKAVECARRLGYALRFEKGE